MIAAIIISTYISIAVSQESQSCKVCNCQLSNVQVLDQLIEEKVNAALTEPGMSTLLGGGATYIRWGKRDCPSINGTELVYVGRAGGTKYSNSGGAANIICLPEDPDYLPNTAGYSGSTSVWSSEYEFGNPLSNTNQHSVPCAVCHVSTRSSVLIIPAKTACPTSWTQEYYGYLTAERDGHHRSSFECIDNSPQVVPGGPNRNYGALLNYAGANCNAGLDCPPYENLRILSCTVCTK